MQNIKNDQQNYTNPRKKGARSKIVPRHKTCPRLSSHKRGEKQERKNEEVVHRSVC